MTIGRPATLAGLLALALSGAAAADSAAAANDDAGRDAYLQHCAACHLDAGQGVPSAFPPLDERLGRWAGSEEGRDYLVSVVSNGLFGPITVNGTAYAGAMPQMRHIDTDQLAMILTYVISAFGGANDVPFSADEVTVRREGLGAVQSRSLRPAD